MTRLTLIITGLVSLVLGILITVPPVAAQEPLGTIVLISQRVELLPQGSLCWRVLQTGLPPGVRDPAEGFAARPLAVSYQQQGEQRVDYAGGPSKIVRAGEGNFIGANNWFARTNIGTVPAPGIVFQLTCAPPSLLAPGTSHIATTAVLPGIQTGPVPHEVNFAEQRGAPGARQPDARTNAGSTTIYVLEGTLAVSTASGVTRHGPGALTVIPPDAAFQLHSVGDVPLRALNAQIWPSSTPRQQRLPDLRLPQPSPAALPRTGEDFSWAGPLAMLVGALLLAAGVGMRRAKA